MTTFYEVRNRQGALVAIHKRRDLPDGTKEVSWLQRDGSAGLNGTPVDALPLYGAHRLAEWPEPAPIVVTEGEKAADALTGAGIPAVGTVCGAAVTPSSGTLADLAGRAVILWPDNDEPGRKHMTEVAARLADLAPVGIVDWPDAPAKGDAADFLVNGRTADDVRELLAQARPAAVGWRTLADIDEAPPEPLLLGMLEPAGPTLLYGAPGLGKGATSAWLAVSAQQLGMRPMVYDAERRPREWARRVGGLGGDRGGVVYVEPSDLGRAAGKPLWQAGDELARIVRQSGADLLFVDSILAAAGVGEERLRSDAQAPFLYVAALDALAIPSVSLGHPPKGQPEGEVYGSMAWTAAMRLTWLGARAEGGADTHSVRWRPRKRNERGALPGLLLAFRYDEAGRLCAVEQADDDGSTREWLLAALADRQAHAVADLADVLLADEAEHVTADRLDRTKERLGKALRRLARDGAVAREGTTRNAQWRRA